ncbi:MAG: M3 family peptidase [Deltaproteobacteria bacterium]|nr:MAG: M3 family peptidase [Deltaproteobacteria bacterium]
MSPEKVRTPSAVVLLAFAVGCTPVPRDAPPRAEAPSSDGPAAKDTTMTNPLFEESSLPYHAPDYDAIRIEHFRPAFERGMADHLAEVRAIADSPDPPTFENTLVALERSGRLLHRVESVFDSLAGTVSNDEIRAIERDMAPRLSAHYDAIALDPKLFARIEAVYEARDGLDPEARRLAELTYRRFVRSGAKLDPQAKKRVQRINARLSELTTQFSQNLLAATEAGAVLVERREELDGLSDGDVATLAEAAKKAGHEGKYLIALQNTTRHPLQSKLRNRDLRRRLFEASSGRALAANAPVIQEIVALRAEKAALLGKPTWAHHQLEPNMAKTPDAVFDMLGKLVPKIMAKTRSEERRIRRAMRKDGLAGPVEPWDWLYYAEKVRAEDYDVDESAVRPYFELERVLHDGLFFAMHELFGIRFEERKDLPVYHPDVRTFEVFDADGTPLGLFYADYFARDGKRGGAWMNAIVGQSKLLGRKPVVVNCLNIPKPPEGQPALLTFDEVQTMFHEMGHAVHGLFSDVTYPSLAGTNVPRDYVEFPSQFEEDWAIDPKVLANYAKHHRTGEPIPADLLARMRRADSWNKGFDSLEYIAAALLDMAYHSLPHEGGGARIDDVEAFERAALERYGVLHHAVPPRYRSAYFAHVFAGGYSAGYYAYIWTEVLAADAFAYLAERGGLSRENGDLIRKAILSRGNTVDPAEMYRSFRGGDPSVEPLLVRRGLVEPGRRRKR